MLCYNAYVYGRMILWMQNKVDVFQSSFRVDLAERGYFFQDGSNNDIWGEASVVSGNGRESDRQEFHFLRRH